MEENQEIYELYKKKVPSDYVIAAVDKADGEISLAIDPGCYNTHIKGVQSDALQTEKENYTERKVKARSLDSIVAEKKYKPPYYIHLDVQGNELKALQGAVDTLKNANIVVSELQLFGSESNLDKVVAFMAEQGFEIFDITDPGYYLAPPIMFQTYVTFISTHLNFRDKLQLAAGEKGEALRAHLEARRARNILTVKQFLTK